VRPNPADPALRRLYKDLQSSVPGAPRPIQAGRTTLHPEQLDSQIRQFVRLCKGLWQFHAGQV